MPRKHPNPNDTAPAAHPWERQPGESAAAHAAFCVYRDLGPRRTLNWTAAVGKEAVVEGRAPRANGRAYAWSSEHHWVERARAWDNQIQAARDEVAKEYAARWERRRMEALDEAWSTGCEVQAKAKKMLSMPLTEQSSEDGKTVIRPAKWGFSNVVDFLRLAAELKRAACEAATRPSQECSEAELDAIVEANHAAKLWKAKGAVGGDGPGAA